DAFPEHELQPERAAAAELDVRAEIDAPARGAAGQIKLVVEDVVPLHPAEHAGRFDVAPRAAEPVLTGEVRSGRSAADVLQLDAVGEHAGITRGARTFERDRESGVALNRHPPHLH